MIRLIAATFTVFLAANVIAGTPNCDAIISHGLRNVEVTESESAATSLKYFNHCQKNFSLMTDSQMAAAEVEVFGVGAGDGSYSRQRREERLEQWCTTNKSVAISSQSFNQRSQTFYQGAVAAWESCNTLGSKDIIIKPVISADRKTVDIGIVYRGGTASGIILSGLATEGFTCSTRSPLDAKPVAFPVEVKQLGIQARCLRDSAAKTTRGGQEFEVLPRGTISLQTSSDPFQLFFPEEWDPGLPAKVAEAIRAQAVRNEIPVGTVIASVLAPDKFFAAAHPQYQASEWMAADGSLLPAGSAYGRLTGATVAPDLRYLDKSLVLLDARVASLQQGQNVAEIAQAADVSDRAKWTWISSGRDNQGNKVHTDWEQDVDHFQNSITNQGVVVSRGRTLNWKKNKWGEWKAGEATVLGIASEPVGLFHYIKIN